MIVVELLVELLLELLVNADELAELAELVELLVMFELTEALWSAYVPFGVLPSDSSD
jgi:hypothetical protein